MQGVIGNPRKAHDAMILITHSNTNAGTGGSSGFSDAKKSGTIEVKLRSTNDMTPLYKGELIGYKDTDGKVLPDFQITIPKWLNPAKLYAAIAATANAEMESKKPHKEQVQSEGIPVDELPINLWNAAVKRLNDLLSQDAAKPSNDSNQSSDNNPLEDNHQLSDTNPPAENNYLSNVSEKAQAFIKYMKEQNLTSIKVRDAYRSFRFKNIRPNADDMKAIMRELENANIGKLVGDTFTIY